jgi:hypothetical protein
MEQALTFFLGGAGTDHQLHSLSFSGVLALTTNCTHSLSFSGVLALTTNRTHSLSFSGVLALTHKWCEKVPQGTI